MTRSKTALRVLTFCAVIGAPVPVLAQQSVTSFALGRDGTSATTFNLRWHSVARPAGWSWAASLFATSDGAAWVGGGVSYTLRPGNGAFFVRGSVMPGLYRQGNGRNLGGALEIATGIEFGTDLRNGAQISVLLEHRSNAGIYAVNPGLNSVSLVYSIPLN